MHWIVPAVHTSGSDTAAQAEPAGVQLAVWGRLGTCNGIIAVAMRHARDTYKEEGVQGRLS